MTRNGVRGLPLIRLSRSQFGLMVAALLVLGIFTGMVLVPQFEVWQEQRAVRHFQVDFGFETGTVVAPPGSPASHVWGITRVVAGGRFDRAGVRPGDVPFVRSVHEALQAASQGKASQFEVWTLQDGRASFRRIVVLAAPTR